MTKKKKESWQVYGLKIGWSHALICSETNLKTEIWVDIELMFTLKIKGKIMIISLYFLYITYLLVIYSEIYSWDDRIYSTCFKIITVWGRKVAGGASERTVQTKLAMSW